MRISKSGTEGYKGLSWMDALCGTKQPSKDPEADALKAIDSEENPENALALASNAAFGTPVTSRTQEQAIQEASIRIQDEKVAGAIAAEVQSIKNKLANSNVDPVALGVVTQAEWENCKDPRQVEAVAKSAALKQIAVNKSAWQNNVLNPAKPSTGFEASSSKDGKIVPMAAQGEDSASVVNRQIPKNANSIFDTMKLDRLAAEQTAHDKMVEDSKTAAGEKSAKSKNWRNESHELPEDLAAMNGSSLRRAGGHETEQGRYKVPSNQISILDDISAKTPEEIQAKIANLFTTKVPDNGTAIRAKNKERSEAIHRPTAPKESVQAAPSATTKDIQKRLMDLWNPPQKS